MRGLPIFVTALVGIVSVALALVPACGDNGNAGTPDGGAGEGGDDGVGADGTGPGTFGETGARDTGGSLDGEVPCPSGLTCDVACSDGGTTSITGKVYDPAGHNPLYNAAVYVPATALLPLPRGVPTGADACSCAALFKSGAIASAVSAVDGSFTLTNVPVGASVPLVIQVGKWRRLFHLDVAACQDNAQPDKSLTLPGTVAPGDTDDNIPDIAVSTGHADTLECLMLRLGLSSSEYVAGTATTGHIHIFSGGDPTGTTPGAGTPEANPMPGAPASPANLWASQNQLMPYDILLLSCEGNETYSANPAVLEAYLNAGGRAFASHFHYAWFSGPIGSVQTYKAPTDWGSNLATWTGGGQGVGPIGGIIDTTLNGSNSPFPKGVALQQWLTNVGALGQNGVPPGTLSIYQPRYNSLVAPSNKPSQAWIRSDAFDGGPEAGAQGPSTLYFSFDTPVNAPPEPDGGPPSYCGRAVFSALHVEGDPLTNDTSPPPGGCANTTLSPQEKALEFMLFDLSSCVIPDTVAPPDAGVPITK